MENDPPSLSSSSSHPNDQLLKEFLEITGSSYQDAQAILESTNYNLENALNLYLEVQPTSSSSAPYAYDPIIPPYYHEDDEVRAPIPVKKQKLIQDPIPLPYFHEPKANQEQQSSIFGTNSRSSSYPLTSKQNKLLQMFKPPVKIIFPGPFLEARNEAKKKNKWLLVNIQRDEEFLSHVLNRSDDYPLPDQSTPPLSSSYYRDVWSDESIQELIQCNFVFWQKQDTSPEGKNFINLYTANITPPCRYPYVCIINPITGYSETSVLTSSMYNDLSPIVKDKISEKFQDFLSSYPFPTNSQENRDRKMNVPVSSVQSNTSYHKRNLEEYLSPVEETPAPSVTSPQMQTLSFESNGFLVSELRKIAPPSVIDTESSQSKTPPNLTIRLNHPSGLKYDFSLRSSSETTQESTLLDLLSKVVSQIPSDQSVTKFDLFYGFPPISLYQRLCRQEESSSTNRTLEDILLNTKLATLQLGGERVSIRYME